MSFDTRLKRTNGVNLSRELALDLDQLMLWSHHKREAASCSSSEGNSRLFIKTPFIIMAIFGVSTLRRTRGIGLTQKSGQVHVLGIGRLWSSTLIGSYSINVH